MTNPSPCGATLTDDGAHFLVRSKHASQLDLCLFDQGLEQRVPMIKIGEDLHEVFVSGVKAGQLYGYRADGPWDEAAGHRFDASKLLIDPCGIELTGHAQWHEALAHRGVDTAALVPKCIVRAPLPRLEPLPSVRPQFIYEVPVKAFTKLHPDVPGSQRGTVAALAHPALISHFKKIGCDAIELMPIAAWTDERHLARMGLRNAWGYNPISFFAPEPTLAPSGIVEVRDTIRVLHENGFRVYLDVVFNHTGESDFEGGTFSLRGLDNATYFRMTNGVLSNDTGCGNTLALDRPASVELVVSALRHWALHCGVDGFRYDLAPVLGRTDVGFSAHAPLLEAINNDPALSKLVHIAEPWDIGPGGYQVGNFPPQWLEWNDHFRDDVRRFWRGDAGAHRNFATRLAGSSDIFNRNDRKPSASVNFVSAHDGFALADVPRFAQKQNHANGEENRDGNSGEVCWIDKDPAQAVKAMLASLVFARGTMMLTAGDEFGRSQNGNNNAYAQDNEATWLDWREADKDILDAFTDFLSTRRSMVEFFADEFLTGKVQPQTGSPDIVWFARGGETLTPEDWQFGASDFLGLMLDAKQGSARLALVFSRDVINDEMVLPRLAENMKWQKIVGAVGPTRFAAFIARLQL